MNIFNSLGSNYNAAEAARILFSLGGENARKRLTDYLGKRYGGKTLLVYKGREALELALNALPQKGAVVMNGFTCLAVYEAIVASGNTVQYLDIPDNALEFSFETLQSALQTNPEVKAVIVQNTLGIPCDIAPIAKLCHERGIVLIEDLAHSIGARYKSGEEAGTVGDFVVLSFSQDKVVDAVSGGALIARNSTYNVAMTTKSVGIGQQLKDRLYPGLTWKIRMAYALGIGRPYHALVRSLRVLSRPLDGGWTKPRTLPSWYCVNILRQYAQLERVAGHRRAIADIYREHLDTELQLPFDTKNAANLRFPIVLQGHERLIEYLRTKGVHISDIWYDAPVAPKKYAQRANYTTGMCPNADNMAEHILNLPTHINTSVAQARIIAELVNDWVRKDKTKPYVIRAVSNKDAWEDFLHKQKPHSFLHSWMWGALQKLNGSNVFRIGVYKGSELVAVALLLQTNARRGRFLLCPHGPVMALSENAELVFSLLTDEATRLGRAQQCDFLRFCPLSPASRENETLYRASGFRDAPIHMHPELAWMLDVTKAEDELLREMRKTTRYLVKKMEKEGVEITTSTDPNDIEKFWPVYQATVERQQFTPFKKNDLGEEFELFAKDRNAAFFFGKQNDTIVAAAIIIFYNGQAFYHHSGSLSSGSNVSYLLQWRVIQEAKKRGCTLYNFWGISPAERPDHPWAGLSLFKKGFGGFAEEYLHAQDKPLTPKYAMNYIVETARRIKRGL